MRGDGGHIDDVESWLSSVSAHTAHSVHAGGHHAEHGAAPHASGASRDALIRALASLEKAVTASTDNAGWPVTNAQREAQRTYEALSGMAHGAKLWAFGNTVGDLGEAAGGLLSAFGVKGANKYFDAIGGAASLYEAGAQQGVTLQNVISGATQGATLGSAFGPAGTAIGAGVGGLLDIFGGLFGHHRPRVPEDKTYDPAMFNSPSDFDYYARLYNLTGKYPNLPGQGFHQTANMVQVHFYSDGVEQAVSRMQDAASTRASTRTASVYYDHTRPQ